MSLGLNFNVPTRGAGTLQTNAGSATVTVSPNSGTLQGDLVVVVCYADGDCSIPVDAGDGWVVLDSGYNAAGFGIFMAACYAPINGASGYAGLTLAASMAWTAQSYSYAAAGRIYDIYRAASTRGHAGWNNLTASAQAAASGTLLPPYPHCLDLVGRGYNNGGTTRTVANITNFLERFDTGQTSPAHGVVLNDSQSFGMLYRTSVTSNISAACINRAGVRALIPMVGMKQRDMPLMTPTRLY